MDEQTPCKPKVVGWVFDAPILETALDRYLCQLASEPAGERVGLVKTANAWPVVEGNRWSAVRGWAAKQLLVNDLLEHEAARLDVRDPSSTVEWAGCLEASGEMVVQRPTVADARVYFRENLHLHRVSEARHVRHILVANQSTARRLMIEARDLSSFALLAERESLDEGSRERLGDLGWIERGQLAGILEEAIFTAALGEVVGPVASAFGWHLVLVEAVRRPRTRSFADCRAAILTDLHDHRRRAALQAWLERRLAVAVKVPNGAEHPLSPGLPGSAHRH